MHRDLQSRILSLLENTLSMLADALFLAIWLGTQYGLAVLIRMVDLSMLDKWVLLAFQLVFAISTLVPVLIYVVKDLVLIVMIERELFSTEVARQKDDQKLVRQREEGGA